MSSVIARPSTPQRQAVVLRRSGGASGALSLRAAPQRRQNLPEAAVAPHDSQVIMVRSPFIQEEHHGASRGSPLREAREVIAPGR
jgi:hypothetical protein